MTQAIQRYPSQIVTVLKDPIFIKQMVWVIALGAVMLAVILANIDYLNDNYPNPPQPPDRILDAIPQNHDFILVGEYCSRLQVVIMAFFFFNSTARLRRLPKLLFIVFVMYILRGFAFTLTPLGQLTPPGEYYSSSNFIAQKLYHGMYFSGHSASALILSFFFWNDRFRGIRITWFVLPFALGEIVSMLVSHQHYSIDVFGAAFVAYFVLTFDFMRLVPPSLRDNKWMPWHLGDARRLP